MATKILIPTALRPFAGRQESIEIDAPTVGTLLERLTSQYGELRRHLYSESGQLRTFVNIYVNDEDIRQLDRMETRLEGTEVVSIIPSIAGGSAEANG